MGYDTSVSATSPPPRPHRAARVEDGFYLLLGRVLRRRGWRPRVIGYPGYGTDGWVRVLARVLLTPPGTRRGEVESGRGWRRFFSAKVGGVPVTVDVGGRRHEVISGRGGYVDAVVPADLAPGWGYVRLSVEQAPPSTAALRVVGPHARLGLVSDVDDTVMITALPRPLLAFWNTFIRTESSRRPVPGMADLLHELAAEDPEAFVIYLSTGPWNVAPSLQQFLQQYGFPRGPMLLTDWGPTSEGWFRSGREHKRAQLRRLLAQLPQLTWLLVGDDGQHDPELYREAAATGSDRVRAVIIRQLSPTEQVLTHGTPEPLSERLGPTAQLSVPEIRAPDGLSLMAALRSRGLLSLGSTSRQRGRR